MRTPIEAGFIVVLLSFTSFCSCTHTPILPKHTGADSLAIVLENVGFRTAQDAYYRNDPDSPFNADSTAHYDGLKWFPIDTRFRGESTLHHYDRPETVVVMGTRGETRRSLRYGYFEFPLPDDPGAAALVRLNVYKFTPYDSLRYALYRDELNVWFTDGTTGKDTYPVGRYVEIGTEHPDPDHLYVIDLNKAYNPYCAYSDVYSCAIPRDEDHIPLPIRAGEKTYRSENTDHASDSH